MNEQTKKSVNEWTNKLINQLMKERRNEKNQ